MRQYAAGYGNGSEDRYLYGREARLRRIRQQKIRAARRRRKMMTIGAVVMFLFLCTSLTGFSRVKTTGDTSHKYYTAVTVQRDDTLWSIAQDYCDHAYTSTRSYIKEIKELNGMKSNAVYYGQKLVLPYYSPVEK